MRDFKLRQTRIQPDVIREAILKPVRERHDKGVYEHFDMTRVIACELLDVKDPASLLPALLKGLGYSHAIDINLFTIPVKPGLLGKLAYPVKRVIWQLLKFYTFRLFHQQREWNADLQLGLRYLAMNHERRVALLREEINRLAGDKIA